MSNRYRDFVWTINNPQEGRVEQLIAEATLLQDTIRLLAFQGERGEAGTHHLQGFVQFANARSVTSLTRPTGLLRGGHVERRGGSPRQAFEYATKDETADPTVAERYVQGQIPPSGEFSGAGK